VKSAAVTVSEHLARLLLLACTVLGVAALHTIGHAALGGLDHHDRAAAAITVVTADAGDFGGCDGGGCAHNAAAPIGGADTSRWRDVCVAVRSGLAVGWLAAGLCMRAHSVAPAAGTRMWRPPPRTARGPSMGLALTTVAILRT